MVGVIVLLLLLLVLEDADDDEKQQREAIRSLFIYIHPPPSPFLGFVVISPRHAISSNREKNAFEYEKTSLFQIQKRVPPMKPSCNRIDRVQHTEFLFFLFVFFPFLDASVVT